MSNRSPAPSDLILDRLTRLHPKIIDLSLDRVVRLLRALGAPQDRLPPVVHVAGTNGKGSVVAYLRAMLEAAGRRVHVYTSPHLVRFNERVRLAGTLIEEAHLAALLEECERVNGDIPITFFEITTAAAFLAFARTPADIVLLETGLGGRLDATNLVARPRLTVLTPISYDHRQHLGDTLAAIAGEKAGIMKAGVPAVVAPQPPEAAAVFAARAAALGVPLCRHGREWQAEARDGGLAFTVEGGTRQLPAPALLGAHQIVNAGTALAAAHLLPGFGLDGAALARGLREVEWPARLQRLTRGTLQALLPAGWELWLDGGHNGAAGEALAAFAAGWRDRPLHLVFGMLDTKEPAEFLAPLAPLAAGLSAVAIPGSHASLTAEAAAAVARTVGLAAAPADGVAEAVAAIAAAGRGGPPARILICGSLYLAGTVLAENG
ncbi:MAG: folylpolyglutamate synthase/dihydrofolate synthase family protein [Dongiaceae bacterium]